MTELFSPEESTKKFYEEHSHNWSKEHDSNPNFWEKEIDRFHGVQQSGSIIDLGCGHGRDARHLIRLGYKYTGVDFSLNQLSENQLRNPGSNLVQADLYHLPFTDDQFDSFWASAVLLHIPKSKINLALSEIRRVSKNQAFGFISIKEGHGEFTGKDNRHWSYYQLPVFKDILKENGFATISSYRTPKSLKTNFMVYFVRGLRK